MPRLHATIPGRALPAGAAPIRRATRDVDRDRAVDAVLASWEEDLKDDELPGRFEAYYRRVHGLDISAHRTSTVALLHRGRQQVTSGRADHPPECPIFLVGRIAHSCEQTRGQRVTWSIGGSPDPSGAAR